MREKDKPIIVGDIEVTDKEREVITLHQIKPIQLEPKLKEFKIDMEILFCKTCWSLDNAIEYALMANHSKEKSWEVLEEEDKQKYIEKEARMRRLFLREHKCLKMKNF